MIKSEIFASVLRDVCEVTGISERGIMSKSKSEEIVDARHLLVVTLRRSGYYPGMIAERLHISGRPRPDVVGIFLVFFLKKCTKFKNYYYICINKKNTKSYEDTLQNKRRSLEGSQRERQDRLPVNS